MRRLPPASILFVVHTSVCLAFVVSAASSVAQPTPRPIQQSTTAITRGQSNGQLSTGAPARYPTMLDMTFPEFEAAVNGTDIVLLPVGSIEEHSAHLPLGTDAINSTAQMFHVQQYLRKAGIETILGPPLNIGITYGAGDGARAADPKYPGNLTVRVSTLAALYLDVLRSLRENGLRWAFLWPGHNAGGHNEALIQAVEEANRTIDGMHAYVMINSEGLQAMRLTPSAHVLSVEKGRNFELMAQLLGRGAEMPRTTHTDGVETSWTLLPSGGGSPRFPAVANAAAVHPRQQRRRNGTVDESEWQWRVSLRQGFGGSRQTDRRLQDRPHRRHHSEGGHRQVSSAELACPLPRGTSEHLSVKGRTSSEM